MSAARVIELPRATQRWSRGPSTFIEVSSQSFDGTRIGVGSSPYIGDASSVGVAIPALPTTSQARRYMVRLCSLDIPSGIAIYLRGYRQYATIGAVDANGYVLEREIVSPGWAFPDANISWHFRHRIVQSSRNAVDGAQLPGTSPGTDGDAPALCYNPPLVPYIPPGGGQPPGAVVPGLGTIYDIRNPWTSTDWSLAVPVFGPGQVTFWASVKQTNPEGRAVPAFCPPLLEGLRPEDLFLLSVPLAVYRRVGGAMLVEQFPIEAMPR